MMHEVCSVCAGLYSACETITCLESKPGVGIITPAIFGESCVVHGDVTH
jgi:hypothetical protein